MSDLVINDLPVRIERAKFRKWSELEDLRDQIAKATDVNDLSNRLIDYLSVALGFDALTLPWLDAAKALNQIVDVNTTVKTLPFMRFPIRNSTPVPYDYPGRTFYMYASLIAKNFGWSLDHISGLDVDDALSFVQEIMIENVHRAEWEWDLSERSSGYDESLKKYVHIPYTLPDWMNPMPIAPKKYRIPKAMIPVGNIVSYRPDAESS